MFFGRINNVNTLTSNESATLPTWLTDEVLVYLPHLFRTNPSVLTRNERAANLSRSHSSQRRDENILRLSGGGDSG